MSDIRYEVFQHYGTAAERAAFTPDPAAGIQPIYIWYETDTNNAYLYDTSWHLIATGSSISAITALTGDVTGTGPGSTATTIANSAVTLAKIANIASDRILGRDTAGSGVVEELTVANGIEFTGSGGIQQPAANRIRQVGITIDGGGSVFTTGVKGYRTIPWTGTITGVRLLANAVGSVVIDIWKDAYASYPPTVADSITAAAKPTITADNKSEDTTLTGWTTSVTAGDVLGFNVDSVATMTRVTLELTISI